MFTHSALAKHVSPSKVEPVVKSGIRYVVPHDQGRRGYIEAWDVRTGKKLWEKTIFKRSWIPIFTIECMHFEYITSARLKDAEILLKTDDGRTFALDIAKRKVRAVKESK